jgi:hypothetical protein
VIIQSPLDPRPPIITTEATTATTPTDEVIRSHDMRRVGLEAAGLRLRANVAELDIVFVARARSDISYCPICPIPHPA